MKAWVVYLAEEFSAIVHESTRGKAKTLFRRLYDLDVDFIEIGCKRLPGLDDKPITYQSAKEAGFEYSDLDSGRLLEEYEFVNDCCCDICKGTTK